MDKNKYTGKHLDVLWDERLCTKVGECERAQGGAFEAGREPWCEPDRVDEDELPTLLARCPTGALHAADKQGDVLLEAPAPNQVTIACDGPFYLRGNLMMPAAPGGEASSAGTARRMALCRCGGSSNKPFCDGSHHRVGFRDSGAVGTAGPGDGKPFDGALQITPIANGPLVLKGRFALVAGTGRVAWSGTTTALCRCGQSKNKPFCDASHREAGFRDRPDGS